MVLMVTGWVPSAGRAPCQPEPPSPYGLRRLRPARRHDTAVASPRPHTLRRTEPVDPPERAEPSDRWPQTLVLSQPGQPLVQRFAARGQAVDGGQQVDERQL